MNDAKNGARMADVKKDLEAVGAEVRSALAALTPADMAQPSGNAGWSVRRVAVHLATTPADIVRITSRVREGRDFKVPAATTVGNIINWWRGFQNRGKTGEQLATQFDTNFALLGQELDRCAGADWERTVNASFQPEPLSLNNWWPGTIEHFRGHLAELTQRQPAA
jgi:hypothetical protein